MRSASSSNPGKSRKPSTAPAASTNAPASGATRSNSTDRRRTYQEYEDVYRQERDQQRTLTAQIAEWRAQAARHRANHDHEAARLMQEMVTSMEKLSAYLHNRAGERVFQANNSAYNNVVTVDCHGLHKTEALLKVKQVLKSFNACTAVAVKVRIVTGRGAHSKDGAAVLLPALKEYLMQQAYPFEEHEGSLIMVFGN